MPCSISARTTTPPAAPAKRQTGEQSNRSPSRQRGIEVDIKGPSSSKLDALLGLDPGAERVLDQRHLGDEVGGLDQLGLGVAAGDDDVQIARLRLQRRHDLVERQIVVAQHDVQLVEQHQPIGRVGDHRLRRFPGGARGGDVAGAVLGVPGKALAHRPAGHEIAKAFERRPLAGAPRALDELDDADPHAVAEAAQHHAEGGGRLALAGAGMDDQQPALLGLGRQHAVARRLAPRHLFVVPAVDLLLGLDQIAHPAAHRVSSSRALLRRGRHNPRSIASRNRRLVSVKAAGLCSAIKLAHLIVGEIGVVERLEMRIVDRARGRGKGEQVIDRRGDLGRPLVAVAHDPGDPARVGRAAADDAADLLAQAADARRLGPRMVVVIDRRGPPRQLPDDQRQPALELVVVVAVEQIVLAVVLVVHDRVGGGEPGFEHRPLGPALGAGAIGIPAPAETGIGEIALVLPDALVDQGLQSGAVGAGLRAEDAVAGAARGLFRRHALRFERRAVGGDARGERVDRFAARRARRPRAPRGRRGR